MILDLSVRRSEKYQEKESAWRNGYQKELARLVIDAQKEKLKFVLVRAMAKQRGSIYYG